MTFYNATNAFEFYYRHIQSSGIDFAGTKAVFNELIHITNPIDNKIKTDYRKWNITYVLREWDWYLSGDPRVTEIKKYAPIWDKMHDGDDMVWSNYGWWWQVGNQMEHMIAELIEKKETRRAILVHYNPAYIKKFNKDTPCNLVLNFYIKDNKLELTVMARSIDLWYGFCNDQWIFSELMKKISSAIQVPTGQMHYFITNLHIYNNKLNKNKT